MLSMKSYVLIMETISMLYLIILRILKQSTESTLFAYFLAMQIGILLGCCLIWSCKRVRNLKEKHRRKQEITQTLQTAASQVKAIRMLLKRGYDLQTLTDAGIPEQQLLQVVQNTNSIVQTTERN